MSTDDSDSQEARAEQESDLTRGERALAKATYGTAYEDMAGGSKDQFKRLLEEMPGHLRAAVNGNLLSKDQVAEGMEDVFTTMMEDDDIPEKWKDGAAVFAKGLQKKFNLEEA